jgi:hypothetical protein
MALPREKVKGTRCKVQGVRRGYVLFNYVGLVPCTLSLEPLPLNSSKPGPFGPDSFVAAENARKQQRRKDSQ